MWRWIGRGSIGPGGGWSGERGLARSGQRRLACSGQRGPARSGRGPQRSPRRHARQRGWRGFRYLPRRRHRSGRLGLDVGRRVVDEQSPAHFLDFGRDRRALGSRWCGRAYGGTARRWARRSWNSRGAQRLRIRTFPLGGCRGFRVLVLAHGWPLSRIPPLEEKRSWS